MLKDIQEIDKKGHIVDPDIADHAWVNASKEVFKIGKEMLPGDEVMFSAIVTPYGITRRDVLDKRDNVVQAANQENKQIFNDYREEYLDWKDSWQNVLQANQAAKQQLQKGLIDRQAFQKIEQQNIETYKSAQPNGVQVKKDESNNLAAANKKRNSYKLVDYQLEDLQQVSFKKERRVVRGWQRLSISTDDVQKIKFTKYLAARSFAYRDGVPFDIFDNKHK